MKNIIGALFIFVTMTLVFQFVPPSKLYLLLGVMIGAIGAIIILLDDVK